MIVYGAKPHKVSGSFLTLRCGFGRAHDADADLSTKALGGCEVGEGIRDFLRVALRLDASENSGDTTVLVDEKGRPENAHIPSSEHRLLAPDAVRVGDGVIGVSDKRERQLVLLLEVLVLAYRIRAHAEDRRIESLEPREGVAEFARLDGSALGGVLGIEVEHDRMAAE
jgi:hypothetical protein